MRKMNKKEKKMLEIEIEQIMRNAVGSDYARYILEDKGEDCESTIMEDVIDDVMCASAWEDEGKYNDDDIRLAIGRVLMDRLRIDY